MTTVKSMAMEATTVRSTAMEPTATAAMESTHTAAVKFTANLDQWAASSTQLLLLGAADIARLRERGSGGKSQCKSTDKTSFDKTVFHE
jgi:hypothetical protein